MIPHVPFAPTSNSTRCTSHRFKRNAARINARTMPQIRAISTSAFISIPFRLFFPCHSWSMQFLRYVLRCLSFAYQFHSLHLLAFAFPSFSLLFHCSSEPCFAIPLQVSSNQRIAVAAQVASSPGIALAFLSQLSLCRCRSTPSAARPHPAIAIN